MPELPEVETIRSDLNKKIKNKTIRHFISDTPKMNEPSFKIVKQTVEGSQIKSIDRIGKLMIFNLNIKEKLLIHLKMTGQLVYQPKHGKLIAGGHTIINTCTDLPCKYTHAIFEFTDKSFLFFNDTRKFGYLKIVNQKQLQEKLTKFGIEPISKQFTLKYFTQLLKQKPNLKIKQVLLNQQLIAGIGNIYADESLFWAGIRPYRIIKSLTVAEIKKLHQQIIRILKLAIKKRGTTVNNYVDASNKKGEFVKYLRVYHQAGKLCKKCKRVNIKKIKQNGRGTSFCTQCQK